MSYADRTGYWPDGSRPAKEKQDSRSEDTPPPTPLHQKVVCGDYKCGWYGMLEDAMSAPNPFIADSEICACPKCFEIEQLRVACDELGCWEPVTCGTPTPNGYRQTCGKHQPK